MFHQLVLHTLLLNYFLFLLISREIQIALKEKKSEIEIENIAQKVEYLINMSNKQKGDLQIKARKVVEKCDWSFVAKEHWEKVYNPLIN